MAGMNAFALLDASENEDPAQISASIPKAEATSAAATPAKPSKQQPAGVTSMVPIASLNKSVISKHVLAWDCRGAAVQRRDGHSRIGRSVVRDHLPLP